MMKSRGTLTAIVLVSVVSVPVGTLQRSSGSEATTVNSLERLTYKTGWILLGGVTADLKSWAFAIGVDADPKVDYLTGVFEIVGRTVDRHKPILPKVGERIRLTVRSHVSIL